MTLLFPRQGPYTYEIDCNVYVAFPLTSLLAITDMCSETDIQISVRISVTGCTVSNFTLSSTISSQRVDFR
jgi:hypothetical protein